MLVVAAEVSLTFTRKDNKTFLTDIDLNTSLSPVLHIKINKIFVLVDSKGIDFFRVVNVPSFVL